MARLLYITISTELIIIIIIISLYEIQKSMSAIILSISNAIAMVFTPA